MTNPDGSSRRLVLKWKANILTHVQCVYTDYAVQIGWRQRSDYRWLRLFRSIEQKQGLPFACLLFLCTPVEQIMLCWKHRRSWMETGGLGSWRTREIVSWKGLRALWPYRYSKIVSFHHIETFFRPVSRRGKQEAHDCQKNLFALFPCLFPSWCSRTHS